jgi:hypothetical protein
MQHLPAADPQQHILQGASPKASPSGLKCDAQQSDLQPSQSRRETHARLNEAQSSPKQTKVVEPGCTVERRTDRLSFAFQAMCTSLESESVWGGRC